MWSAAAAKDLEYLGSASDGDTQSRVLQSLVRKGGAKEEEGVADQQQQLHQQQYQHASPDVADAMSWFFDDALFCSPEQEQIRAHVAVIEEDEEVVQVAPVKRELKLSIELPPKMESRVGIKETTGRVAAGGARYSGNELEDAAAGDDDSKDPYLQLSPRSRRKRKNRDQMRQARQKEKVSALLTSLGWWLYAYETMQKLRDTVERLEDKYVHAMKEKEALASGNGSPFTDDAQRGDAALRFPYMTSYTQASSASPRMVAATTTRGSASSSRYSELMSAASRLKEENFRLKQTIHEKHKLQETLERHFSDFCESSPASLRDGIQHMDMGDSSTDDYYVPMTTEGSWRLIRDTHERIHAVQQAIAKRVQEEEEAAAETEQQHQSSNARTSNSKPNYFGWRIQYHTQEGMLLFSFEKPFYHVTALQAMEQMWTNECAMQSYRSARDAANQTLKIVQHINDDTYVVQRRLFAPAPSSSQAAADKYITTMYLRFRLKTARGYLVGQKSIDKDDFGGGSSTPTAADAELCWASKLCLWTEFIQETTPYGHEFFVVRVSGSMNLQSGELNGRVVAEAVIHLLRWETMTIGPVFTLSSE